MTDSKQSSSQDTINFSLAKHIKELSEKQQLILLKQLLKGEITATLFKLIREMSDDQQSLLLKQLQEDSAKTVNLEEIEIALRSHTRKSCMLSTAYTVEGRHFEGFMLDISPAGAFIETGETFSPGQEIHITLSLPNYPGQLTIKGEILWKGMLGIGVKFTGLSQEHTDIIHAFVQKQ